MRWFMFYCLRRSFYYKCATAMKVWRKSGSQGASDMKVKWHSHRLKRVSFFVVISIICIASIYTMKRPHYNLSPHDEELLPVNGDEELQQALLSYADDAFVVVAYADYGFIEMTLNFYVSSLAKHNISNYVFISTDSQSCEVLQGKNIHCYYTVVNMSEGGIASTFKTQAYNMKTHFRTKLVLDALRVELTVLLVDVDIVFLNNPMPLLRHHSPNADVIFQSDGGKPGKERANGGFFLARPTRASIEFFHRAWQIGSGENGKKENDQDVKQRLLKSPRNILKPAYLDQSVFQNGCRYWSSKAFDYTDPWHKTSIVIVHNTCLATIAAKIYRFKESQMWKLDNGGYYTNDNTKYLTYSNPIHGVSKTIHDLEQAALVNALSIGYILNRTVILPDFHCYACKSKKCSSGSQMCSLYYHIQISIFDSYFGSLYREHVFLNNSLTSEKVKNSISNLLLISSTFTEKVESDKEMSPLDSAQLFQPENPEDGASVSEIQSWFRDRPESVLHFRSLYHAFQGFPDVMEYQTIKERLQKALQPSNPSQLNNVSG